MQARSAKRLARTARDSATSLTGTAIVESYAELVCMSDTTLPTGSEAVRVAINSCYASVTFEPGA